MAVNRDLGIDELKAQFDDYGFVVIPDLIPKDVAHRAAERLMELMRLRPDAAKPNQNLHGLFNYSEPEDDALFLPLITNPVYLELAQRVLGEDMQLAAAGGGCNWWKPGAPAQALHVDVPNGWFVKQGFPVPDVCLFVNSLWMLTDFVSANGATRVVPFSHLTRRAPRPGMDYKFQIAVEGTAGSIVIFNGKLWHGAGANTTTASQRVGLSVGYHSVALNVAYPGLTNWIPLKRAVHDRLPQHVQKMFRWVTDD
jgi:hypothetical protein